MTEHELQINKIAQGLIDVQSGVEWFVSKSEENQKEILRSFQLILRQSHPRTNEISEGIKLSGLKPTYTPCVIMLKKTFAEACNNIQSLPHKENLKSFTLWLSIFSLADSRRRATDCKNGCTHEWHNINEL